PVVASLGPGTLAYVRYSTLPAMAARTAITPVGWPATSAHVAPPSWLCHRLAVVFATPTNRRGVGMPAAPLAAWNATKLTLVGEKLEILVKLSPPLVLSHRPSRVVPIARREPRCGSTSRRSPAP